MGTKIYIQIHIRIIILICWYRELTTEEYGEECDGDNEDQFIRSGWRVESYKEWSGESLKIGCWR